MPGTIAAFDALLRHAPFAEAHRPDVVVRLGSPPASKVLDAWIASSGAHQIVVADGWIDPGHTASTVVVADPSDWCASASGDAIDAGWLRSWLDAETAAQAALDGALAAHEDATEPFVARAVAASAPGTIVVSSSMPVRDVEWYAGPRADLRVMANRGANGIDGVVSTAVGVALGTGGPVTALVGDVAFLHDANALLGLAGRDVDLTVVVVDNRGGGIFSFLPQAAALSPGRFELLFGTPHDVDLPNLSASYGVPAFTVHAAESLAPALAAAAAASGPHVVVVPTDRHANVGVHDELHAAVAAAL